jgi:hypothetical protein
MYCTQTPVSDVHVSTSTDYFVHSIFQKLCRKDATQVFFSLHRHEVLLKPQYARLQIGKVRGQEETIKPQALAPGELSQV